MAKVGSNYEEEKKLEVKISLDCPYKRTEANVQLHLLKTERKKIYKSL